MQAKSKREKQLKDSPIYQAFHGMLSHLEAPKKEKKIAGTGRIVRNDAERMQMSDQIAKKEMAENDLKRIKMEESPLLKAFSRQREKQSQASKEK